MKKHTSLIMALLVLATQGLLAVDEVWGDDIAAIQDVDSRAFSTVHRPASQQREQTPESVASSDRIALYQQNQPEESEPLNEQTEEVEADPVVFSYVRDFLDQCVTAQNHQVVEDLKTSLVAIEQLIAKAGPPGAPVVSRCEKLCHQLAACFHASDYQVTQARTLLEEFAVWLLEYQDETRHGRNAVLVTELLKGSKALLQFLSDETQIAASTLAVDGSQQDAAPEEEEVNSGDQVQQPKVRQKRGSWLGSHASVLGVLGLITAVGAGLYANTRSPSSPSDGSLQGQKPGYVSKPGDDQKKNPILIPAGMFLALKTHLSKHQLKNETN